MCSASMNEEQKGTFLCSLHGLSITSDLGRGSNLRNGLKITNNPRRVAKQIPEESRDVLGTLEVDSLLSGLPLIYADIAPPNNVDPDHHLITLLYEVEVFLSTLWFVKDNSVNAEVGYLIYPQRGGISVSSNFISNAFTTAQGDNAELSFSKSELNEARQIYLRSTGLPDSEDFYKSATQLVPESTRVSRAAYVVQAARGEADLGLKICHYCTALETLFSTSNSELSHQLSERVAYFLGESDADRVRQYRETKRAYSYRSKFVHGSTVKPSKRSELKASLIHCDSVLRKAIRTILEDEEVKNRFSDNSQELDAYMLELILRVPNHGAYHQR